MSLRELSRINLNLLVCLQALLEERSVTQAAARLSLSQSAVSKSLSRLREICGDPLFTRTAHGLIPTPRALALKDDLRPMLDGLWNIVQPQSFEPALCQRYFRVALPETTNQLIFQKSLNNILSQAPLAKIKIKNLSLSDIQQLSAGNLDLVVLPSDLDCGQKRISGLYCRSLYANQLVCLVREDHPCLKQVWNQQAWLTLRHVGMGSVTDKFSIIDRTLNQLKLKRNIVVAVDDFHNATGVCENTDLLLICTQQWAEYAMSRYKVAMLPVPLNIDPITHELYWHQRHQQDPAHQWLRSFFIRHT
ncbi:LysR family transcriptional regulator [Parendozoicomonas sp. Alg238-R29]|uniref:LysR family transcriptional regulator n=1 Tax=Parendozoicomonas sp. Alg238-R29 TaxID=2993446 RepID=UPI00248D6D2D|nr:LysR family transcriptional regulator [Parendozoicomonas sp. Alg238-R29]